MKMPAAKIYICNLRGEADTSTADADAATFDQRELFQIRLHAQLRFGSINIDALLSIIHSVWYNLHIYVNMSGRRVSCSRSRTI
jgi:hypothetical protein